MWYARWFKVITNEQAKELGLVHVRNIYGDEINKINCRSIWEDAKGRKYRVELLYDNTTVEFREWYLRFREEVAKSFGANYSICIASWTFSENYKYFYDKGLTPKEAMNELRNKKEK